MSLAGSSISPFLVAWALIAAVLILFAFAVISKRLRTRSLCNSGLGIRLPSEQLCVTMDAQCEADGSHRLCRWAEIRRTYRRLDRDLGMSDLWLHKSIWIHSANMDRMRGL